MVDFLITLGLQVTWPGYSRLCACVPAGWGVAESAQVLYLKGLSEAAEKQGWYSSQKMSLLVRSEYSYWECQCVTQQGKGLNAYTHEPGNSEDIQVTHQDRPETSSHLQGKKGRHVN